MPQSDVIFLSSKLLAAAVNTLEKIVHDKAVSVSCSEDEQKHKKPLENCVPICILLISLTLLYIQLGQCMLYLWHPELSTAFLMCLDQHRLQQDNHLLRSEHIPLLMQPRKRC